MVKYNTMTPTQIMEVANEVRLRLRALREEYNLTELASELQAMLPIDTDEKHKALAQFYIDRVNPALMEVPDARLYGYDRTDELVLADPSPSTTESKP